MTEPLVLREPGGTITVASEVVRAIVRQAAEAVDGVEVRKKRLRVKDGRVEVGLAVRYGAVLPEVGEDVQGRIAEGLRTMCGLDPAAEDVSIEALT